MPAKLLQPCLAICASCATDPSRAIGTRVLCAWPSRALLLYHHTRTPTLIRQLASIWLESRALTGARDAAPAAQIPIAFSNAQDRNGYVYLPPGFRNSKVPVMVIFHGLKGSGHDMINMSKVSRRRSRADGRACSCFGGGRCMWHKYVAKRVPGAPHMRGGHRHWRQSQAESKHSHRR